MNRRDFLNTLGTAALGAGAGIAISSVMFAIPAQGAATRHVCTWGYENGAKCWCGNTRAIRAPDGWPVEMPRGPKEILQPDGPRLPKP